MKNLLRRMSHDERSEYTLDAPMAAGPALNPRPVLRKCEAGPLLFAGKTSVTIRSPSVIEPPHFRDFNYARAESRDENSWLSGGITADGG